MKPRVLMIAYACDPQGSGEHWLGWGWAEQAARSFEVDLITTSKARAAVESHCQTAGITPHFVDVPNWLRTLTEAAGASWWRKLNWQKRARTLASRLQREKGFSIVHQTTFHTFRVPFRSAGIGVPAVWGPIAGGERVPPGFEHYLGSARLSELSRTVTNRVCLRFPSIQRSLRQTDAIFVSNRTSLGFLPAEIRGKCQLVPPNALRPEDEKWVRPSSMKRSDGPLRLLYAGNCVATRAIPIVLEALQQSGLTEYEFQVAGAGPALRSWQKRAEELRMSDRVKFVGKVPRATLDEFYASADVFVFPALRDSGGSALLEAMVRQVPVICLDWAGPGEMVEDGSGLKVPVTTPEETVRAFAAALNRVAGSPPLRAALSQAARVRAESLFGWGTKRMLLEETYRRLMRR